MKLLIANRGEIAVRIGSAASDLGIESVAVYSEDDARSLHVCRADSAVGLDGVGALAYLDQEQILRVGKDSGCDAVHPGYGFLSEDAEFARQCLGAGLAFVGPTPDALSLFGDKAKARLLAEDLGIAVVPGISEPVGVDRAREFFASLPAGSSVLVKAVSGGGGRGIRLVAEADQLEAAHSRAQSEAQAAFGVPDVYVERFVAGARHVEVQIAGDSSGGLACFGDRDCSLQRRNQKILEIGPAPSLPDDVRHGIVVASLALAEAANYQSLGTFEFLVEGSNFYFIEANARLQVEHTVTEEVTGIDLVQLQIRLARGESLDALGFSARSVAAARSGPAALRAAPRAHQHPDVAAESRRDQAGGRDGPGGGAAAAAVRPLGDCPRTARGGTGPRAARAPRPAARLSPNRGILTRRRGLSRGGPGPRRRPVRTAIDKRVANHSEGQPAVSPFPARRDTAR